MSEKKEAKKAAPAQKVEKVKKSKVDQATKIKRDANGKKKMKVAKGSARAARREGLKKGWRNVANSVKMKPAAGEAVEASA